MKDGRMHERLIARRVGALFVALMIAGCSGLLDVEDPERYTSEDLDESLEQVADGVEGWFNRSVHLLVTGTALLGDEYQASDDAWPAWQSLDEGRVEYGYGWSGRDPFETLLQARWFAGDARERLERVLGDAATRNPGATLIARVNAVDALADLYLAQSFCEAPVVPGGPAVSDVTLYRQAVTKFTRAIQSAQVAGSKDWEWISLAGRARAQLLLGDYDEALADASVIPDSWSGHTARHTGNDPELYNGVVEYSTYGFLAHAGVRKKWWDSVDHQAHMLRDPWTGEPDPRIPIFHDGSFMTDNVTPHFSQWKYRERGDDIPILEAEEMRLIEAEVHWKKGNLPAALALMNALRAKAGLGPLPDTNHPDTVFEYLLHERFAEMFLEGQRLTDLHRFGLVQEMVDRGDFEGSRSTRPTKFPLSRSEATYNANIEDDAALRCPLLNR